MAFVTESFVVDLDCTRPLTPAERRDVAAVITVLLGPNFGSTHRAKAPDFRAAVAHCARTLPAALVGAEGYKARIKTEALTSRDHDAPVALTLECGGSVDVIARFHCIADAETYLNENPEIDPVSLHLGAYGIDAPFGVASDHDGDMLLNEKGYRLHATTGGGWTYSDRDGALCASGFSRREAAIMHALAEIAFMEEE